MSCSKPLPLIQRGVTWGQSRKLVRPVRNNSLDTSSVEIIRVSCDDAEAIEAYTLTLGALIPTAAQGVGDPPDDYQDIFARVRWGAQNARYEAEFDFGQQITLAGTFIEVTGIWGPTRNETPADVEVQASLAPSSGRAAQPPTRTHFNPPPANGASTTRRRIPPFVNGWNEFGTHFAPGLTVRFFSDENSATFGVEADIGVAIRRPTPPNATWYEISNATGGPQPGSGSIQWLLGL